MTISTYIAYYHPVDDHLRGRGEESDRRDGLLASPEVDVSHVVLDTDVQQHPGSSCGACSAHQVPQHLAVN